MKTAQAGLTDRQARMVEHARKVPTASAEDLAGPDYDPGDLAGTYAHAFGWARGTVSDLLTVIDELTG